MAKVGWLVLKRKPNERVYITVPPSSTPTRILVSVTGIEHNTAKLGFNAPVDVTVHRGEIQLEVDQQEREAAESKRGDR